MKSLYFKTFFLFNWHIFCAILALNIATGQNNEVFATEIYVKVTMDSILYIGDDLYEMKTRLTNISDKTIDLSEYRQNFIIQNDGIGKWTSLKLKHPAVKNNDMNRFRLSPGESKQYVAILEILPSIPHLYKNYDGEVNVRFESNVIYRVQFDQHVIQNDDESSYWLKLQSSNWILREGM